MQQSEEPQVHTYGSAGPPVIVLHGGPAARGSARPIAQGLADTFRVFEPWQRGSGREPLTVARHIADLHEIVNTYCRGTRPALVGESWGAMLALAYAAAHPDSVEALVLVGCGTFDPAARSRLRRILKERKEAGLPLYTYEPVLSNQEEPSAGSFDRRAHTETWNDMVRLQDEGVYPSAFSAIRSPVIMLHGTYDPHPGPMVRDSLKPYLPQLEYHEWERCGHSPWNEKFVRDEFFTVLREWLTRRLAG